MQRPIMRSSLPSKVLPLVPSSLPPPLQFLSFSREWHSGYVVGNYQEILERVWFIGDLVVVVYSVIVIRFGHSMEYRTVG